MDYNPELVTNSKFTRNCDKHEAGTLSWLIEALVDSVPSSTVTRVDPRYWKKQIM